MVQHITQSQPFTAQLREDEASGGCKGRQTGSEHGPDAAHGTQVNNIKETTTYHAENYILFCFGLSPSCSDPVRPATTPNHSRRPHIDATPPLTAKGGVIHPSNTTDADDRCTEKQAGTTAADLHASCAPPSAFWPWRGSHGPGIGPFPGPSWLPQHGRPSQPGCTGTCAAGGAPAGSGATSI